MSQVALDTLTGEDRREIDQELELILAHTLFRHSRRLPAFLQHVVQESLRHGEAAPLKERTLGVEVFGRKPDYDTNADPIVRVTATELRKKLAQYYYTDGRESRIHIELPPGTYLPLFRRQTAPVAVEAPAAEAAVPPEQAASHTESPASEVPAFGETRPSATPWKTLSLLLAALLVITIAGYYPVLRRNAPAPIDTFWTSFAGSAGTTVIVMPVIRRVPVAEVVSPSSVSVTPSLSIEDTTIASRVAGRLEKANLKYWLASSSDISFSELRTGPAIFIGALDNAWTLRLSSDLPFHFEESADSRQASIVSRDGKTKWTVDITTPHQRIAHDYGIVAKFRSPLSGEPSVLIAGISSQGTQAAGELLTSSTVFKDAFAKLRGVENFELVVETQAVDGRAGPPHIVALKTW
ncbi:hypothetical protein ACFQBQ_04540 [Granulicella cerasi]|uniref:Adenylate cyclase n=1 Tax=Granulicella cerasi TaxID=741063 RepID=A0ABW1Z6U2_9BACT|nr:hypothetical protein [Granulicella cerasi]